MAESIDITPTWQAIIPIIVMTLENPDASFEALKTAESELQRMAKLADLWVEHEKAKGLAECGAKRRWDKCDVIAEYDGDLNMTLAELSRKSLWTIAELKALFLQA